MVDRTQEDVVQDTRIATVEQRIRELTDKLDTLTRRVGNNEAWSRDAVAHLGNQVQPVAEIEKVIEKIKHDLARVLPGYSPKG